MFQRGFRVGEVVYSSLLHAFLDEWQSIHPATVFLLLNLYGGKVHEQLSRLWYRRQAYKRASIWEMWQKIYSAQSCTKIGWCWLLADITYEKGLTEKSRMNKNSGIPDTVTVTFIRLVTLLTSSYHGEVNPLPYYWQHEIPALVTVEIVMMLSNLCVYAVYTSYRKKRQRKQDKV